ncbi:MAG: hypothetical protein HN856_12865 [Gammaproteobacteria bacterium]|jgi:tRNA A-37 threonylcarbamoyl transferase component Bud32|nr:hypothetical protein [Gammaproteobacteria bacterium]
MSINAAALVQADRSINVPFTLEVCLTAGLGAEQLPATQLTVETITRLLPGRRISGVAQHEGRSVFVKLFYGKAAARYWQRELAGASLLARSKVSSPAMLAQGKTLCGGGYFIFYAALPAPRALETHDSDDMHAAVGLLAQLHEADLVHSDPHIFNFLHSSQAHYVVDADGIEQSKRLRQQLTNLATLLAQRTPLDDRGIKTLWSSYIRVRGQLRDDAGALLLVQKLTLRQRALRVRRYLRKTQRDCTPFRYDKSFSHVALCQREHWLRLQPFIAQPDVVMSQGEVLKEGNSATVVRIQFNNMSYIVKRYNLKNTWHWLKRMIKRRARRAWVNGHRLDLLGIRTARPIALLERRWGFFNGICYLVMEDVGSVTLQEVMVKNPQMIESLSLPITEVLLGLSAARLIHGDLKATNFVVYEQRVALIDYDGLAVGRSNKDKTRFLANWDNYPQLKAAWLDCFIKAGL